MKPTLLVDGDALAYRVAAANEKETEWAPGELTLSTSLNDCISGCDLFLAKWKEEHGAANVRIAISDQPWTFRMDVYKPYKAHRADKRKPLGLKQLRQWLIDERAGVVLPGLEADDLMGLWMTDKYVNDGIIVSWDKDMRAVPGRFWIPGTEKVEVRDEFEADLMWMAQALSGDAADGYPGCKNVGVVRAKRIVEKAIADNLDKPLMLETMWEAVKATYLKAGQTEEDALVTARLARILRHGDYDLKEKKVRLWSPPTSDQASSRSTVMLRVRASQRQHGNYSAKPKPLAKWEPSSRSRIRSAVRRVRTSRVIGAKRKSATT